jgi:VIT1/CCC1 family predicted Fe2+/Mn2+ transporter
VETENIARCRTNLRSEQESAFLYRLLAKTEPDEHLSEVYRRLAAVEEQHASIWAEHIEKAGQALPPLALSWRIRVLSWIARHFGARTVLPMVSSIEVDAADAYRSQPLACAAGMPGQERSHARIFRVLEKATPTGLPGAVMAHLEGRHRGTGGNALRAAVLGASDGLTSNLSLVMGVAGANLPGRTVFFTGLAGLVAGALSMAIGEWLSVQSARELYEHQVDVERQELSEMPEEEEEELALIYQAKGLDAHTARKVAGDIIHRSDSALDTLVREELGIDPKELGGSAWVAALTSFLLFSAGAIVPALPFAFNDGMRVVAVSLLLSILGLFVIGAGVALTTGVALPKAAGRQIVLGLVASALTFGLGRLFGAVLG